MEHRKDKHNVYGNVHTIKQLQGMHIISRSPEPIHPPHLFVRDMRVSHFTSNGILAEHTQLDAIKTGTSRIQCLQENLDSQAKIGVDGAVLYVIRLQNALAGLVVLAWEGNNDYHMDRQAK